ncbi:PAS domain S-box protein [Magnetospira sp. QH-2]|uniref:PAS domain-containing sensor histidine kinase n=1 Tax=Magnetospira sp. (strain QH-2) TaxID=1288970 RepID=UPI0003E810E4|nr:PAS domain S-box protein [Magnetospira sp. QH-2]CCQ75343.1 putative Histidine kinase with PAS sensor domain [Magnetospira sp. QH-2]
MDGMDIIALLSLPIAVIMAGLWLVARQRLRAHAAENKETARQIRSMVAATSEGFWVIDPVTKVSLDVNDALCVMLGYGREEILGKTPLAFADEANAAIFKEQTGKIGTTDHRTYEITLTRKDGSALPCMFNATTLRAEETREAVAAFAFVTDLTQIKASEAELRDIHATLEKRIEERTARLRESELRFRRLYEQAPLPYQSLNAEGRIIEVNDAWLKLMGYGRLDVIGRPISQFLAPGQETLLEDRLPRFLKEGDIHDAEFRMQNKTGDTRIVSVEGQIGYEESGDVRQTHCILTDITSKIEAERELRRSEEKYRRLVEEIQSEYFLYSHTVDGVFDYVSPSVTAILGYRQNEFMTHYGEYLTDCALNDQVMAHTEAAIRGEKQPPYEVEITHKDGSVRRLEVAESPVTDESGRVVAVEGIAHDVTQNKEAEARMLRTVEELTQSNIELERFAYVASHDLQEPLRTIISFSQLLSQKHASALDDEAKEYLEFVAEGATRMSGLVNGLLEYSRVTARAEPFGPVKVGKVLDAVQRNLNESIVESGVVMETDDLPEIRADGMQIGMLFQNLISNAIKYRHPDRPLVIRLQAERRSSAWRFSVADNGTGIAPRYHARVFEIFRRLHSPSSHPGTGIGLALCKRIVERHGGRIWVDSEEDEGACFRFDLPFEPQETPESDESGSRLPPDPSIE